MRIKMSARKTSTVQLKVKRLVARGPLTKVKPAPSNIVEPLASDIGATRTAMDPAVNASAPKAKKVTKMKKNSKVV